ncbi:MAG: hypothetical protein KA257_14385 [Opitutaceae bacterium]|nr:hypothetical protein [Opitutaceae bacterium]
MRSFVPGKPFWWQWPTVLSLDAPAVALLWQWQLMRVVGLEPSWHQAFILGTSVWLAYAADRWIEGWRLQPGQIRTQRHYFYQRWRWPLCGLWLTVLAADLEVSIRCLSPAEFRAGWLLLVPVGLYLLSHQFIHRHHRWRAPKEICVALLLGAGVALFPLTQPVAVLSALAVPLILFCLLCFANCALISVWEHDVDQAHGQTSLALQFRRSRVLATTLPWVMAVSAAALALSHHGAARTALLCAATSSVFLGLLHLLHEKTGPQLARVLADGALLTPLVPLLSELFFVS